MPEATGFRDSWRARLEGDLSSFSDPGSLVELSDAGRDLHASWRMWGKVREAIFTISLHDGVRVKWNGEDLAYASFMASEPLSNLRYVAKMILQAAPAPYFVPTEAELDGSGESPEPAVELLRRLIEKPDEPATQVVMLTGDAGAGKTAVLRHLTEHYARLYLRGQTRRLLLYVNAQGRALARLHEALATELQDLKVTLTYHSIATLARLGILVPVIDGFDELLGVSGYDDAFSSLSGFLDDLEGEGCVLASARSPYYEEEFVARAGAVFGSDQARWTHFPVRVLGWSDDACQEFLDLWAGSKDLSGDRAHEIGERTKRIFAGPNANLKRKPLFFTKVVELLLERPDFRAGDDLLGELVREYLDRELKEKLLDRQSAPLLTRGQLDLLMREIAQEMWSLETRELDARSLREVAEYVSETEDIPEAAKAVVVERMPSLAFLARNDRPGPDGRFAFEHEAFFSYFLAAAIVSQFESADADIRIVLGRSALPEIVAERVAPELGSAVGVSDGGFGPVLERLCSAGATPWLRSVQVRENAGRLSMALLRMDSRGDASGESSRVVPNVAVRNLIFPGGALEGVVFQNCMFENVTFRRTDLTGTEFVDCSARDSVLFVETRVDRATTRLVFRGLDESQFTGLLVADDDAMTYDSSRIREALADCGLAVPRGAFGSRSPVDPEIVGLLDRLMRAYRRANPVCLQDDALRKLVSHPKWDGLKARLIEYEIVTRDRRETGGRPKEFLRRRFRPDQIMAGRTGGGDGHPRVRRFWRSLGQVSGGARTGAG